VPRQAQATELEALQTVIAVLQSLDEEARDRILQSAITFLGVSPGHPTTAVTRTAGPVSTVSEETSSLSDFSTDRSMSPKEFLLEKQPRTDVERIAVLAYYLTHYRDIPHFKTLDLSKLNTEAAQPKFSNTANSANNAVKRGYLVPAVKGHRQLSAAGEQFVRALPDRDAARAAMTAMRPRRRKTTATRKKTTSRQTS
jgi:hypothetical protein